MAVAARALPYARPAGLATPFLGSGRSLALLLAGAVLALGVAAADGPRMLLAVFTAVAAGALVHALARRRLGGFTGDTLGASGVVAETVGLLVAVALVRR
jgi:adenosylcobinamide-GDP ribazoletransferase